MANFWSRWWGLSSREKWTLLRLVILLPLIAFMLRISGFSRSHARLQSWSQPDQFLPPDFLALEQAERFAQLANIAGRRGFLHATCLPQALLVQWWLRRQGLDAKLKLGTRKLDGHFDAHAWVELQGHALAQARMEHVPFADWQSGAT